MGVAAGTRHEQAELMRAILSGPHMLAYVGSAASLVSTAVVKTLQKGVAAQEPSRIMARRQLSSWQPWLARLRLFTLTALEDEGVGSGVLLLLLLLLLEVLEDNEVVLLLEMEVVLGT